MPSLHFPMSPERMWFKGKSCYTSHLKLSGYETCNAIAFGHRALVTLDPLHQMEDLVIIIRVFLTEHFAKDLPTFG